MKRRVTTLSLRVATPITVGMSTVAYRINQMIAAGASEAEVKEQRDWHIDEARAITGEVVDREDFNDITVVVSEE